jgi:hypothetical protein
MNPRPSTPTLIIRMLRVLTWSMAAVLAAGAAFAVRAPASEACSTRRVVGVRSYLFMLATARGDTVRAGPGPIQYEGTDTAGQADIHGQRFRLDRLGGDVPAELAGATEAVLVPYASACRETWRSRKARWAGAGSQVLVDATLRPRAMWAGGIPTFDVDMEHAVYPDGWVKSMDSVPDNLLDAVQVFELNQVLPTWEHAERAPDSAYAPLLAWARANPRLAARYPASEALEWAHDALQPCIPAYDPHPVAGTYRATVIVNGRDTLTYFFRTSARGFAMCGSAPPPLDEPVLRPRMADTARLYVNGSADEAAIPEAGREAWEREGSCGTATLDVVNRPRTGAAGKRGWQASYDVLLSRCFPGHAGLKQAQDALDAALMENERTGEPGWFHEDAAGGMRFEQVWRLDGRVIMEIRAVRVSPRTTPAG